MIAPSIIELTPSPAVVCTKGAAAPSASLFGDLLRQALKISGEDTPAASTISKPARHSRSVAENVDLLPAAPSQVIVPTPIPLQQTILLQADQTTQPAHASLSPPTSAVPPLLSPVPVAIKGGTASTAQPLSKPEFSLGLTPYDTTVPLPPAIVTKPDLMSAAAAPDAPVHSSVASKAEHWIQNTLLSAVPGSIQNLNPIPTLHAVVKALTGAATDPAQNSFPKDAASVPPIAGPAPPVPGDLKSPTPQQAAVGTPPSVSDPSTGPDATGLATATAAQLAAVLQSNQALPLTSLSGKPVTAKASPVTAVAAKESNKDSTNALNVVKQQLLSDNQKTGSPYAPKEQDQTSHAAPGSIATVAPANQAGSPVIPADHSSSVVIGAQAPPALLSPPTVERAVNTPDLPAPVTAPPQSLPDINTAKIIQSVGQSEMRVGMRSTEFGNISISTSASRDVISAQISVDHTELARTLAVHLPEMQARLGGAQSMEVRIDMQGQATSQTHGSSTGMANHSADTSREEHAQRGHATHARSAELGAERPFPNPVWTLAADDLRLNQRLDITA